MTTADRSEPFAPAALDEPRGIEHDALCATTYGAHCDCEAGRLAALDEPAARALAVPSISAEDEAVARLFHETYERLAPEFGYKTCEASAVPWPEVPDNNARLMTAVAAVVRAALVRDAEQRGARLTVAQMEDVRADERERIAKRIEADMDDWLGGSRDGMDLYRANAMVRCMKTARTAPAR